MLVNSSLTNLQLLTSLLLSNGVIMTNANGENLSCKIRTLNSHKSNHIAKGEDNDMRGSGFGCSTIFYRDVQRSPHLAGRRTLQCKRVCSHGLRCVVAGKPRLLRGSARGKKRGHIVQEQSLVSGAQRGPSQMHSPCGQSPISILLIGTLGTFLAFLC